MKLTSMVDFVLENSESEVFDDTQLLDRINNYANFIKQPLELWMFIPCDDNGNVLEDPDYSEPTCENEIGNRDELIYQYQQAKERILFEGFTFKEIKTSYEHYYIVNNDKITWLSWNKSKTVENLLDYNQEIKLAQTGLNESELARNFGKRKQWLKEAKNAKFIDVEKLIYMMRALEVKQIQTISGNVKIQIEL